MADCQADDRPDHFRRSAGSDFGNDGKQQLQKDQRPPSGTGNIKRRCSGSDFKKMDEKKTMYRTETAVMDAEKRNDKEFAGMFHGLIGPGSQHFQNIVKGHDQVLDPVEQHDIFDIPAKKKNTNKGDEVGTYQGPGRKRVSFFDAFHVVFIKPGQ